MYIHIGSDKLILIDNILIILDLKNYKELVINREFFSDSNKEYIKLYNKGTREKKIKKENFLEEINNKSNRSLIVVQDEDLIKVYISPVNSQTLLKRKNFKYFK